ncbi:hypothetical protein AB0I94_34420 [Streptomyces sp. NPDC050147]|uniref:hypothetical protein n=1 Tax=Streptomyces sp. NPDC050147 TaxID=3155513 RepID=UPI003441BA57
MTTLPELSGTLPLPDLQFPVSSMVHPDADRIEGHLTRWATDLHLLSDEAAARRFARAQFGRFAAYCHPHAANLETAAAWNALMWFIDDVIDEQQGSDEAMLDLAHDLNVSGRYSFTASTPAGGRLRLLRDPDDDEDGPAARSRQQVRCTAKTRLRFEGRSTPGG